MHPYISTLLEIKVYENYNRTKAIGCHTVVAPRHGPPIQLPYSIQKVISSSCHPSVSEHRSHLAVTSTCRSVHTDGRSSYSAGRHSCDSLLSTRPAKKKIMSECIIQRMVVRPPVSVSVPVLIRVRRQVCLSFSHSERDAYEALDTKTEIQTAAFK